MRHSGGSSKPPPNLPLAALVFVAELVLWFGLGLAVFTIVMRGGGGPLWAVVGGAGATIAVVALWGTFVAPRAPRRLRFGPRLAIIVLLDLATGAVFIAAGWMWAGIAVAIGGGAVQIAGQSVMRDWAGQGRGRLPGSSTPQALDTDDVT